MKKFTHGGNIYRQGPAEGDWLDYSANINPLGLAESVKQAIAENVDGLVHYPDPDAREIKAAISKHYDVNPENIVMGNGAAELFYLFFFTLKCRMANRNWTGETGDAAASNNDNYNVASDAGAAQKKLSPDDERGMAESSLKSLLLPVPSFSEYERAGVAAGLKIKYFYRRAEEGFRLDLVRLAQELEPDSCVIIGNPDNPAGTLCSQDELEIFIAKAERAGAWVLVDESFMDFVEAKGQPGESYELTPLLKASDATNKARAEGDSNVIGGMSVARVPNKTSLNEIYAVSAAEPRSSKISGYSVRRLVNKYHNLFVVQSLTKFYAIPGLRLGFGLACPELRQRLELGKDVWNVNLLAQRAGVAALADVEYQRQTYKWLRDEQSFMVSALQALPGVKVFPPAVNFMLLDTRGTGLAADELLQFMESQGILIRDCRDYEGLSEGYFRIAIRKRQENERLLDTWRRCLGRNG